MLVYNHKIRCGIADRPHISGIYPFFRHPDTDVRWSSWRVATPQWKPRSDTLRLLSRAEVGPTEVEPSVRHCLPHVLAPFSGVVGRGRLCRWHTLGECVHVVVRQSTAVTPPTHAEQHRRHRATAAGTFASRCWYDRLTCSVLLNNIPAEKK